MALAGGVSILLSPPDKLHFPRWGCYLLRVRVRLLTEVQMDMYVVRVRA